MSCGWRRLEEYFQSSSHLTSPVDVKIMFSVYLLTSFRCVGYLVFSTFRCLIDGDVPFGYKLDNSASEINVILIFLSSALKIILKKNQSIIRLFKLSQIVVIT